MEVEKEESGLGGRGKPLAAAVKCIGIEGVRLLEKMKDGFTQLQSYFLFNLLRETMLLICLFCLFFT